MAVAQPPGEAPQSFISDDSLLDDATLQLGELDITTEQLSLAGIEKEIEAFADSEVLRAILDQGETCASRRGAGGSGNGRHRRRLACRLARLAAAAWPSSALSLSRQAAHCMRKHLQWDAASCRAAGLLGCWAARPRLHPALSDSAHPALSPGLWLTPCLPSTAVASRVVWVEGLL